MIYPILTYDNPILRQKSLNIEKGSKLNINQLTNDMFETMHKANGIGLSAIQIGLPLNLFVIEAHSENIDLDFKGIFLNPKIVKEWGPLTKLSEACLSLPSISAQVERFEYIELEWFDIEWKKHIEEFNGIQARIIQHEYDHLNGNLFIDKLDKMWSTILEMPLTLIRNNKIDVSYSIK